MIVALIPARLKSIRLPHKPLLNIENFPLVMHVYKRAKLAKKLDKVIVCADDIKIVDLVKKHGGEALITKKNHKNGTERIQEIAKKLKINTHEEAPDVRSVFEKAQKGDVVCKETLEYTFQVLGKKLSDLIHILTPEAIVFCGNISNSLDAYMPIIKRECERNLLNNMRGKTNYKVSDLLDQKMNLLGPASLAFNKKLDFA